MRLIKISLEPNCGPDLVEEGRKKDREGISFNLYLEEEEGLGIGSGKGI